MLDGTAFDKAKHNYDLVYDFFEECQEVLITNERNQKRLEAFSILINVFLQKRKIDPKILTAEIGSLLDWKIQKIDNHHSRVSCGSTHPLLKKI